MEAEICSKIKETVIEILKSADMDGMTEYKVRNIASQKLGGMNLSLPEPKQFVRNVLEAFLLSTVEEEKPISVSEAATTATVEEVEEEPPLPSPLPEEIAEEKVEEKEKEEVVETKPEIGNKDTDEYGDVIICRLSEKRRVTVQDFKGKTLVSIREYYQKDGKHFPSSKGISLSNEQWSAFRTAVPAIEEAIKTMELRLGEV
ncbi:hypothetical protein C5167_033177 [Papaver somniferum]|uniref:DEK-C domain-containing protein n=1 Tax=Papaver somniferum TaxID=3469 RepID=A0A4Y7K9K4_PAPSO|nr:RNA polymerase II transcriptional coactivator KELP-like isoform X3 [Papaver somniferum]RZC70033.1 hypothetical protein C5167_033177 [Papaver somniferum]